MNVFRKIKLAMRTGRKTYVAAIIAAGGSSARMGFDKMLEPLDGAPVIARTVAAFEVCPLVDEIIVVAGARNADEIREILSRYGYKKLCAVVAGGAERFLSVKNGIAAVSDRVTHIAVHDGARPLVSQELIAEAMRCAFRYGAAVPVVAVSSTVRRGGGMPLAATAELSREGLYEMQTPQIFDADLLKAAVVKFAKAPAAGITDEAGLFEKLGARVYFTRGSKDNIKLTQAEDIRLASALISARKAAENV
jgi:2-C-methyl-D-erythritol 4-phosphate cytidylyltransferase